MSFSKFATPEDFQRWEDHAKVLDCYTLKYIIKDCQSAEKCMRGFDPIREGYYSDQAVTYGMEFPINRCHQRVVTNQIDSEIFPLLTGFQSICVTSEW